MVLALVAWFQDLDNSDYSVNVTHFEVDDLHASRPRLVQLCLAKFLMLL